MKMYLDKSVSKLKGDLKINYNMEITTREIPIKPFRL